MFIKTVILDGFKSYGKRTEIDGFDPEFTAITGLNGTGKSNILDSICFVLGISNLSQVRATNLQELVYKGGQAGITKASVTIVFDNSDQTQCPMGYDKCKEISVTRIVVVGGKNKYLINGKNVPNKKVTDLFCSVQLNVNNPNFLIMQGRITKVLNMKPHEILSMIEEASGTSLYESKREDTMKLIEKKEAKLREMNSLLKEEIEPKLEKLRGERAEYLEYQKIVRDIEYLTRIHISYKFLQQKKSLESCESELLAINNFIETSSEKITSNEKRSLEIDAECQELQLLIDNQHGGLLSELEKELSVLTTETSKANGVRKAAESGLEQEKRKLKSLQKNLDDDEKVLSKKNEEMSKVQDTFQKLKDADEMDSKAYAASQKKFEAISAGLATNEDGEATSLQDQLINAKQQLSEATTNIKKSEMEIKHLTTVLRQKQGESKNNDAAYNKDKKLLDNTEMQISQLTDKLSRIDYEDGRLEQLEERKSILMQECRGLQRDLDGKGAHRFDFKYRDPESGFDHRKVKGRVCTLFNVQDPSNYMALGTVAGGSLYSVVTDTDVTSKKILNHGQLQQRTTFIPMNKISGNSINPSAINVAERLVGQENVAPAISLIEYAQEFDTVMKYVFGSTLVCRNMDIAKKVAYDRRVMCRSVTLDGDVADPSGTLSGGSRPSGPLILQEISDIKAIQNTMTQRKDELNRIFREIEEIKNVAAQYHQIKEQIDTHQHQLQVIKNRLATTSFQQHQQEIDDMAKQIETLKETIVKSKELQDVMSRKARDIEDKLSDAKGYRERELAATTEEMKQLKKKSEDSRRNWKKREEEFETLRLEIEDLQNSVVKTKEQVTAMEQSIEKQINDLARIVDSSKTSQTVLADLEAKIKIEKNKINSQNREIKLKFNEKNKMNTENNELKLAIKKKENEMSKLKNENKDAFHRLDSLKKKYTWIETDQQFFGVPKTTYDYTKEDPVDAGKKLHSAQQAKEKMERHINLKAMILLEREEEQYKELIKRKEIVMTDKRKIQTIIKGLDEQKKLKVQKTWKAVNQNFGDIFSMLLPGAQAGLIPPANEDFTKGLTVRVGFNGMWKESLSELSGGQRSLVALSLILAMLKFNPAPLYILDEVDAALDISHTQNIGNMFKTYFRDSQFIIVSLKDGMFNNANVLFKTKFEDGVSAVTRTINRNRN